MNSSHQEYLLNNVSDELKHGSHGMRLQGLMKIRCGMKPHRSNLKVKNVPQKYKKYQTIKITPIGINNLCFQNSTNTVEFNKDYKMECGWCLSTCPCGKQVLGMPHYINYKYEKGKKKYYDFTSDVGDAEHRHYVFDEELTNMADFHDALAQDWMVDNGCKCGARVKLG